MPFLSTLIKDKEDQDQVAAGLTDLLSRVQAILDDIDRCSTTSEIEAYTKSVNSAKVWNSKLVTTTFAAQLAQYRTSLERGFSKGKFGSPASIKPSADMVALKAFLRKWAGNTKQWLNTISHGQ